MSSDANNEMRYRILEILYRSSENAQKTQISSDQLAKQLRVPEQTVRFNLSYLEKKGLISQERIAHGARIFSFFSITLAGVELFEGTLVDDSASPVMAGYVSAISSDLNIRTRTALLNCGPFASNQELEAVFVDVRINAWRNNLPEATDRHKRVECVMDFLSNRFSHRGENALALFLRVLSERVDPKDDCHKRLCELANELEVEIRK